MADSSAWDVDRIPDQQGRVAIVTGSSSGIGLETARILASRNAEVIIAVRNLDKGNAAVENIKKDHKDARLEVRELDLADLSSVAAFAEGYREAYPRVDILINNAGVMIPPYSKTKDGFELQFGTNHLGHFALTAQLFDILAKTPGSRVVNVSSNAHKTGNLDFEDLNWEKRGYSAWKAYSDSKIANLHFTKELDRRIRDAGIDIKVLSAHPGWTATDLQRHSGVIDFLNNFFAQGTLMGALPTLRAAVDDEADGAEYYGPGGFMEMRGYPVRVEPNDRAKDGAIARELWKVSEEMTGIRFAVAEEGNQAAG